MIVTVVEDVEEKEIMMMMAVSRPHLNLGTTELMSRKLKVMIRDAAWNEKSLRRVFTKFDEKGNGEITAREFKKAFNKLIYMLQIKK